jgi:hypothetical protein
MIYGSVGLSRGDLKPTYPNAQDVKRVSITTWQGIRLKILRINEI